MTFQLGACSPAGLAPVSLGIAGGLCPVPLQPLALQGGSPGAAAPDHPPLDHPPLVLKPSSVLQPPRQGASVALGSCAENGEKGPPSRRALLWVIRGWGRLAGAQAGQAGRSGRNAPAGSLKLGTSPPSRDRFGCLLLGKGVPSSGTFWPCCPRGAEGWSVVGRAL